MQLPALSRKKLSTASLEKAEEEEEGAGMHTAAPQGQAGSALTGHAVPTSLTKQAAPNLIFIHRKKSVFPTRTHGFASSFPSSSQRVYI